MKRRTKPFVAGVVSLIALVAFSIFSQLTIHSMGEASAAPTALASGSPSPSPTSSPITGGNPCDADPYCYTNSEQRPLPQLPVPVIPYIGPNAKIQAHVDMVNSNLPPTTNSQTVSVAQNGNSTIVLSASDPEGAPLSFHIAVDPYHGTLLQTSGNTFVYSPASGFMGRDAFAFVADDGVRFGPGVVVLNVGSSLGTLVTVAPGSAHASFGQSITVNPTLVFPDASGTTSLFSTYTRGAVSGDYHSFIYTPGKTFGHDFVFMRTIESAATQNVGIGILPITVDAPAVTTTLYDADPDAGGLRVGTPLSGTGDLTFSSLNVSYLPTGTHTFYIKSVDGAGRMAKAAQDYFVDNLPPTVTWVSKPTDGSMVSGTIYLEASITDNVPNPNGQLSISAVVGGTIDHLVRAQVFTRPPFSKSIDTSAELLDGEYEFRFDANDIAGNPASPAAVVRCKVDNYGPITSTTLNGTPYSSGMRLSGVVTVQISASDAVSGVRSIDLLLPTSTAHADASTLTYSWDTTSLANGVYSLTVKSVDNVGHQTVNTLSNITVSNNKPPVSQNQNLTTAEDTALNVSVSATDPDGDPFSYLLISGPANGTLQGTLPNVTYMPNPNFFGVDSFKFAAKDSIAGNTATVTINVTPVNDKPVAQSMSIQTTENISKQFSLVASDVESPMLTYAIVTAPLYGTVTQISGATWQYTPLLHDVRPDQFSYKAIDTDGLASDPATVSVSIVAVNDAPVLDAISNKTVDEGTTLSFKATASDIDGPSQKFSLENAPLGASIDSNTGQFTWTPTEAQGPGDYFIRVWVSDLGTPEMKASQLFSVHVNEVNQAPTFLSGIANQVTKDNTTLTFSAPAYQDLDVPSNTVTYSLLNAPTGASINPITGIFSWTPTAAQRGIYSNVGIKITDSAGASDTKTFSITVQSSNQKPVPLDQTVSVTENVAKTIGLTGTDADGDPLSFVIVTGPANGTLSSITGANVTYTPRAYSRLPDSFTFKANDGKDLSDIVGTISINILPVNTAPVLAPIAALSGNEGTLLSFNATATDVDGDAITYTLENAPAGAAINPTTGNFSWTPSEVQGPGTYTIRVWANDNGSPIKADFKDVTVTVAEVNQAPVFNTGISDKSVAEHSLLMFSAPTVTDTDYPANVLTYSLVNAPSGATIDSSGIFQWTPTYDQAGSYSNVGIRVTDNGGLSDLRTFSIWVTNVNRKPVANAQILSMNQGTSKPLLLTGSDADGDPLSFKVLTSPTLGTLTGTGATRTYKPRPDATGSDSFTFVANDGTDDSLPATVSIDIRPASDVIQLAALTDKVVNEGTLLNFTASATDTLGNPISYSLINPPSGAAIDSASGLFSWTPTEAQGPGVYPIGVKVIDQVNSVSVSQTINVTVNEVNQAPVFTSSIADKTVTAGQTLTFTAPTVVDNDIPANAITYSLSNAPSGASINPTTGVFTWTPTALQLGLTSNIQIVASDGAGGQATKSFSVQVQLGNVAPVAFDQSVAVVEDTPKTFTLSATDANGDPLTVTIINGPTKGTLSGSGLSRTYTPNANVNGSDSFVYKVSDGLSESAQATVLLSIAPINDAPVLSSIGNKVVDEGTTLTFTASASDVDGPSLSYSLESAPAGASIDSVSGVFTWTPTEAQGPGVYPMKVWVNDNGSPALSAFEQISITVNEVNTAPSMDVIPQMVAIKGLPVSFKVNATDSDLPRQTLTFSLLAGPSGATIDPVTGIFTWTPTQSQATPYPISVRVSDNGTPVRFSDGNTSILVKDANHTPTVSGNSVTVIEDTPAAITLTGSDPDGLALSFVAVQQPTKGRITGSWPTITYTPNPDANGTDSFTFAATDGVNQSAPAVVQINILPVNDAPVAQPQSVHVTQDTDLPIALVATDVDSPALTYFIVKQPDHGNISGTLPNALYAPDPNFHGTDTFSFKASDGQLTSAESTVTITVDAVNHKPAVVQPIITGAGSGHQTFTFPTRDVDGDLLTFVVVRAPSKGHLSGTLPTIVYDVDGGQVGTDDFVFHFYDGHLTSDDQTVTLQILDLVPPSISLPTITDRQSVSGLLSIQPSLTDVGGVALVEFIVDGITKASPAVSPFVYSLNSRTLSNGDHQLKIRATDFSGNQSEIVRTLSVNNGTIDKPVVSFVGLTDNQLVGGTRVPITVSATSQIDHVDLTINGRKFSMPNVADGRYQYVWDSNSVPDGAVALSVTAVAVDGQTSDPANLTLNVDNTPPVVEIVEPTSTRAAAGVFGNQPFDVLATDSSGIESVKFYLGATNIATLNGRVGSNDYEYVLHTTSFSDGTGYSMYAVAIDRAGNVGNSVPLVFTINNANPVHSPVLLVEHPKDGAYATSDADAQISLTFSEQVDLSSINSDSIHVRALKDGKLTTVAGQTQYVNGQLVFIGAIPTNSQVTWDVVNVRDSDNRVIDAQYHFIRTMARAQGGTVSYETASGRFSIDVPKNALPADALVAIELMPAGETPDNILQADQSWDAVNQGHRQVAGPFKTYMKSASDKTMLDLSAPVSLSYQDLTPPKEAEEQGRVVQIQGLDGSLWRPLGTSGLAPGASDVTPGIRQVTVPVSKLSTFRVTSLSVPSSGIAQFFNFPNPFSPNEGGTSFHYLLGADSHVTIVIFDLFGNLVKKLEFAPGSNGGKIAQNIITWDGKNGRGEAIANGGYVAHIVAEDGSGHRSRETHKLAVVK